MTDKKIFFESKMKIDYPDYNNLMYQITQFCTSFKGTTVEYEIVRIVTIGNYLYKTTLLDVGWKDTFFSRRDTSSWNVTFCFREHSTLRARGLPPVPLMTPMLQLLSILSYLKISCNALLYEHREIFKSVSTYITTWWILILH